MADFWNKIKQRLPQDPKKIKSIVTAEIVGLAALLTLFGYVAVRNARSMNVDVPVTYQDTSHVDTISASSGKLIVNNVSIDVPTERAEYTISYGWAEKDEDYPTIPLVGTVTYKDDNGTVLYEISLYKDVYYEKADIPEGKTVDNWFDNWATEEGGDAVQEVYTVKDIKGIRITASDRTGSTAGGHSGTCSYYFVTALNNGDIAQYVIEGTCRDAASQETFDEVMTASIDSLTIEKEGDQIEI